ncbi:ParB-like protein [Azorhizobium doebereinerae]|uniref:ParB-like protein n=1 Tax=Azorhizobium doebereinerae TaxID=281091 RepID=UPI00041B6CD8|nr:ParB-like protein [Azorhizobium doebereinerae]
MASLPSHLRAVAIDDLHPTQLTLGMEEVARRAKKMMAMSEDEVEALLRRKAIPCVLGPGQQLYLIDHHHLCRAALMAGYKSVYLDLDQLVDRSRLDRDAFWEEMEREGNCWPIDADGNRRPYARIPDHVRDLTDNPWRTLARAVRGPAFRDDDETPFKEFMWGEYFRSFMSRRLIETDLDLARELAVKLAHLDEAQDLPGYQGSRPKD